MDSNSEEHGEVPPLSKEFGSNPGNITVWRLPP